MARRSYPQHDQNSFSFSNPQAFNLRTSRQQQQQQHSVVSLPHPGSVGANSSNADHIMNNNISTSSVNTTTSSNNALNGLNFPSVSSQLDESTLSHRQISRHINNASISGLEDFNSSPTNNQIHASRAYQQQAENRSDPFQHQLQRQQQQQQRQQHMHNIHRHENIEEDSAEMYSDARQPPAESSVISVGQKRPHDSDMSSSQQQPPGLRNSHEDVYNARIRDNSEPPNERALSASAGPGGKNSRGSYTKWSTDQTRAVFDSLSRRVRESETEVRWSFPIKILEAVTQDLIDYNRENHLQDTRSLPTLLSAVKHHIRNTKDKYIIYAALGNKEGVTFNDDGWLVCEDSARKKQLKHAKYFREAFPVKKQIEDMLRDKIELQETLKVNLKGEEVDDDSTDPGHSLAKSRGLNNMNSQDRQNKNDIEQREDSGEEDDETMHKSESNGQSIINNNTEGQQNTSSDSLYMNRSILNQALSSNSFNTGAGYKRSSQHRLQQQRQQQQQQQHQDQNQHQNVGIQDLSGPLPMLNMNVNGINNINPSTDVSNINSMSNMNNDNSLNDVSSTRPSSITNISNISRPSSTVLNRGMAAVANRVGNPLQINTIGSDIRNEGNIGTGHNSSVQVQGPASVGHDTGSNQQNNNSSNMINSLRAPSPSLSSGHLHHTNSHRSNHGGSMTTINHLTNIDLLSNIDDMGHSSGNGQNPRGSQSHGNSSINPTTITATTTTTINNNSNNNNNSNISTGNSSSNDNSTIGQMLGATSSPSMRNTATVSRVNQHPSYRHTNSGSFSGSSMSGRDVDTRSKLQTHGIANDGFQSPSSTETPDMSTYYMLKYPPPSTRGTLLTMYLHCDPRGREIMEAANRHPSRQKFDCLESICLMWATEFFNELKKKPGYNIVQGNLQQADSEDMGFFEK